MNGDLHCFHFVCRQKWSDLTATADPAIRHCGLCRENVYWCKDAREVLERGRAGQCAAIGTPDGPMMGEPTGLGPFDYANAAFESRRRPRAWG